MDKWNYSNDFFAQIMKSTVPEKVDYIEELIAKHSIIIKPNITSDSMIDVGSLILDNANVKIIDTIVTTTTQPSFNGANFTAIDASFNRDLSFSTPYNVTLINVNEPQFFNITAMGSTMVYVYWWLTVRVKDSRANPLPEAEVYIWNYTATMEIYHIPY